MSQCLGSLETWEDRATGHQQGPNLSIRSTKQSAPHPNTGLTLLLMTHPEAEGLITYDPACITSFPTVERISCTNN